MNCLVSSSGDIMGDVVGNSGNGDVVFFNDVDAAATDVVPNDKQGNDAAVAVSVRECKIPLPK